MSRVTKDLASDIAISITKKQKDELEKAQDELRSYAQEVYERRIPEEVKKFFKSFPKFIKTTGYFRVNGNGFNHAHFNLKEAAPNIGINLLVELNKKEATKLIKLKRKEEDLYKAYKELKRDIENAIYSLRTFKKVKEQFPEAADFLPQDGGKSYLPSLKLDSIRERLNK